MSASVPSVIGLITHKDDYERIESLAFAPCATEGFERNHIPLLASVDMMDIVTIS